jgi:hypothetical protein
VLRHLPKPSDPNLLLGIGTDDDAAFYRLTDELALVQTVDVFTPIVDDPYTFGSIAAANALSDIYAKGGRPLLALNIAGFPRKLPLDILVEILRGGAEKAAEAAVKAGKTENLEMKDIIREKYRGIRPAPGYPACPDHTEKRTLFDILAAETATGINLTESFAMHPASSVSGFYFNHPESKYFAVGKLAKDQVEDYTLRKDQWIEVSERWLAPNLDYEPK